MVEAALSQQEVARLNAELDRAAAMPPSGCSYSSVSRISSVLDDVAPLRGVAPPPPWGSTEIRSAAS